MTPEEKLSRAEVIAFKVTKKLDAMAVPYSAMIVMAEKIILYYEDPEVDDVDRDLIKELRKAQQGLKYLSQDEIQDAIELVFRLLPEGENT